MIFGDFKRYSVNEKFNDTNVDLIDFGTDIVCPVGYEKSRKFKSLLYHTNLLYENKEYPVDLTIDEGIPDDVSEVSNGSLRSANSVESINSIESGIGLSNESINSIGRKGKRKYKKTNIFIASGGMGCGLSQDNNNRRKNFFAAKTREDAIRKERQKRKAAEIEKVENLHKEKMRILSKTRPKSCEKNNKR